MAPGEGLPLSMKRDGWLIGEVSAVSGWRGPTSGRGQGGGGGAEKGCYVTRAFVPPMLRLQPLRCVTDDAGDSWRKIAREFGEIRTAAWLPS